MEVIILDNEDNEMVIKMVERVDLICTSSTNSPDSAIIETANGIERFRDAQMRKWKSIRIELE